MIQITKSQAMIIDSIKSGNQTASSIANDVGITLTAANSALRRIRQRDKGRLVLFKCVRHDSNTKRLYSVSDRAYTVVKNKAGFVTKPQDLFRFEAMDLFNSRAVV